MSLRRRMGDGAGPELLSTTRIVNVGRQVKLDQALQLINDVVAAAAAPVSVFVADERGELVAAATMDGAAPDTGLNARRKAYTVARSDALSTRALSQMVGANAAELASFDPFYCFFVGGIAVLDGTRKVGAIGVSGLTGDDDEALAVAAVARLQ